MSNLISATSEVPKKLRVVKVKTLDALVESGNSNVAKKSSVINRGSVLSEYKTCTPKAVKKDPAQIAEVGLGGKSVEVGAEGADTKKIPKRRSAKKPVVEISVEGSTPEVVVRVPCRIIGIDLGGSKSDFAILNENREVVERGRVVTRASNLQAFLSSFQPTTVVIEVGTVSPWVSRLIVACGHRVIVANARKVGLIKGNKQKDNRVDAELLARLGLADEALLHPIQHRGEEAQKDLAVLRSRDTTVRLRSSAISSVRGTVRSYGGQVPRCSAAAFGKKAMEFLPSDIAPAVSPVVRLIQELTEIIKGYDREIDQMVERYPEVKPLMAIVGVGALTALAFILTLESADRFSSSRAVGAFVGLVPGSADTGDHRVPLRITKEGDALLRRLLVNAAHYILGPFGPSCDLRRHGERIMGVGQLGSKSKGNAKKRAVIAVARKLAVLLHVLWKSKGVYDPQFNSVSNVISAPAA